MEKSVFLELKKNNMYEVHKYKQTIYRDAENYSDIIASVC